MNELHFISIVKEHKILYNKINYVDKGKQLKIWEELAKDFELKNGHAAYRKWQQLTENYIFYLRGGESKSFPYANEMQFIQPYLIGERHAEDSYSEPEIDETELERFLYSDEELEPNNIESESTVHTRKLLNMEGENIEVKDEVSESAKILQNVNNLSENNISAEAAFPTATTLSSLSSLELIFLGYARELQKMPLSLQLQTKRKIADIMNEAEMKLLTN